jgi:hypothetical protein
MTTKLHHQGLGRRSGAKVAPTHPPEASGAATAPAGPPTAGTGKPGATPNPDSWLSKRKLSVFLRPATDAKLARLAAENFTTKSRICEALIEAGLCFQK